MKLHSRIGILCLLFCTTCLAAEELEKPRIVVEWGQNTPDTIYLRRNIEACERVPINGVATFVSWPRSETGRMAIKPIKPPAGQPESPLYILPSGKPILDYSLGRRVIGKDRITEEQCAGAIEDLKSTNFQQFQHMHIGVLLGNNGEPMNWFDDEHWAIINHNIALIARTAREGGCDGIFFDPEIYAYALWTFDNLYNDADKQPPVLRGLPEVYAGKSWQDVQAAVKRRGYEFARAIESEFPSPHLWFMMGYGWAMAGAKDDPANLPHTHYALLPAFLDGIIEGSSDSAILIDGNEGSYRHKTAEQFVETRRLTVEGGLKITTVPEPLFHRKLRVGYGLWVDADQKWDPENPRNNSFTPQEFETALRHALEIGDGYVWLWSETADWYADGPDWKPADDAPARPGFKYVPQAYRDAIENARKAP